MFRVKLMNDLVRSVAAPDGNPGYAYAHGGGHSRVRKITTNRTPRTESSRFCSNKKNFKTTGEPLR